MLKKILFTLSVSIAILLVLAVEVACAKLAFETLGEIDAGLYYLLIGLNIIPVVLLIAKRHRTAILLFTVIGLLVIPYQLYLGHRLFLLKTEAANITAYLYRYQAREQHFPTNLSGYTYAFPKMRKFFSLQEGQEGPLGRELYLSYYVGTPTTSHFYLFNNGTWGYHPD